MLGALLAQGFSAWDTAVAATWLHGRAADDEPEIGLVASDVPSRAAAVLVRLRSGLTD
jgi:NAD(P)H-hydrate repair Nnr-like enzyme with NAD(P)H-hydrate dehydratase domain